MGFSTFFKEGTSSGVYPVPDRWGVGRRSWQWQSGEWWQWKAGSSHIAATTTIHHCVLLPRTAFPHHCPKYPLGLFEVPPGVDNPWAR